jgi:predicted glycoside hydrolase/deacetylase ChbG (UPF0249 family)
MIVINADDWGRCRAETDVELACFRAGSVTSVSAMVFMDDSERAAELARQHGVDVGLHFNLSQSYNGRQPGAAAVEAHQRIVRFMTASKYAVLIYRPGLRKYFRDVFQTQLDEFLRLYGKQPSHVDGHQHRHLCANVLLGDVIPRGLKVRRNFSFWPGEKSAMNRAYRRLVDSRLARRYRLTDYFFSLGQCLKTGRMSRVVETARVANVELMTHPIHDEEKNWLLSNAFSETMHGLRVAPYAQL